MCGLFSLIGKITPLISEQFDSPSVNSQVQQSKCPLKNALPNKIYSSQTETKEGGEHFINSEGTYTRFF